VKSLIDEHVYKLCQHHFRPEKNRINSHTRLKRIARRRNNLFMSTVSIILGIKNAFQLSSADVKSRIVKRSFFSGRSLSGY
jgi:hypothetical protein